MSLNWKELRGFYFFNKLLYLWYFSFKTFNSELNVQYSSRPHFCRALFDFFLNFLFWINPINWKKYYFSPKKWFKHNLTFMLSTSGCFRTEQKNSSRVVFTREKSKKTEKTIFVKNRKIEFVKNRFFYGW